jgi:hypothetical protein
MTIGTATVASRKVLVAWADCLAHNVASWRLTEGIGMRRETYAVRTMRRGLGDDTFAAAMIDRLVHHADVVAPRGDSYRLKNHDSGRLPQPRRTNEQAKRSSHNRRYRVHFQPSLTPACSRPIAAAHTICGMTGWPQRTLSGHDGTLTHNG